MSRVNNLFDQSDALWQKAVLKANDELFPFHNLFSQALTIIHTVESMEAGIPPVLAHRQSM
ncbi:hypothetical protein HDU93_004147 [Gonapodya sp. JEL0774]|nr:hypothetical protein HDU93_004147 [Gonapodya sp. JEL0774]